MPRFSYSAISSSGAEIKGDINAPDDLAALDQLSQKGFTVLSLNEGGTNVPWWQRDISLFGEPNALDQAQQLHFFTTLHSMLSSGFKLDKALRFVSNQSTQTKSKRLFNAIADFIDSGGTLAGALEESRGFPSRLISLVRLGESANQLEVVSSNIVEMLSVEARNSQQVRQALVYPTILLIMSLLVLLMLIFFLAPTLVPVFRSANVDPPALLNGLNGIGIFLKTQWPLALTVFSGIAATSFVFRGSLAQPLAAMFAFAPGVRAYLRTRDTLRFLQTLYLMLRSGAQLPIALGEAGETAISARWRVGIQDIRSRVEAGDTLLVSLRESGLPDTTALAFVEAGEESDQLTNMLRQAARHLDEQNRRKLDQTLRLLTPMLTLVIGLTIGFLIFTTIGAILDLNDLAA